MRNLKMFFSVVFLLIPALLLATTHIAINQFQPLNLIGTEDQTDFRVFDQGLNGIMIDISLQPVAQSLLDKGSLIPQEDNSELKPFPVITRWVVIPRGVEPSLVTTSREGRRFDLPPNSNYARFIDQREISSEQLSLPNQDDYAPVSLGKPGTLRGVRMVPIMINPVQTLNETTYFENAAISVDISFETNSSNFSSPYNYSTSTEFTRMIDALTLNPPMRDPAPSSRAEILIIHSEGLTGEEDAMASVIDFANWKRRLGFDVRIEQIDVQEQEQDALTEEIHELITEGESPIEFLIIMGHFDLREVEEDSPYYFPVWTDTIFVEPDEFIVEGDSRYVLLDEDDYLPDVIVGRFMCVNYDELDYALDRSIGYEQEPAEGDWLNQAIYTFQWDRDSVEVGIPWLALDTGLWIYDRLGQMGYTQVDTIWNVKWPEINEPVLDLFSENNYSLAMSESWLYGLVTFDGDETGYEYEDTAQTGAQYPFVISNAEHYGVPIMVPFFNSGNPDEPNGAIGGYGFWVWPYDLHSSYVNGWTVWAMINLDQFTGGYLFQFAGMQMFPIAERNFNSVPGTMQLMSSYMYLGDPTLQIRNDQAFPLTVNHPDTFNEGATMINLSVQSGGDPVTDALVCIFQDDNFKYVNKSNANGEVFFTIPEGIGADGEVKVTVVKHNGIAYVADVEIGEPAVNLVLEEGGFSGDEQFRNGEEVNLELTFRNRGEENAEDLTIGLGTDNDFLTFSSEEVGVENIDADATGSLAEDVQMTLDPDCPGGTIIQVQTIITSGDLSWSNSFEFTSSGPRLEITANNAANFGRNLEGTISPELSNSGDLPSSELEAQLVTLTDEVSIEGGVLTYDVINAEGSRTLDQPFSVNFSPVFVPGQIVNFELSLSGENDYNLTIPFSVQGGEPEDSAPLGPDSYGYFCFDSDDDLEVWHDSPEYVWYEINPDAVEPGEYKGNRIYFEIDEERSGSQFWDEIAVVELPFSFNYYGESFDSIVVNTNGWLSMGTDAKNRRTGSPLPVKGISAPENQISPYWLDFDNGMAPEYNGVFTHYDEQKGIFIIEWSLVQVRTGVDPDLTFEVVLYDPEVYPTSTGDGEIVFYYQAAEPARGFNVYQAFPTIGIRSPDGNDGIQYSWNDQPEVNQVHAELAVKFTTTIEMERGSVQGRVVFAQSPDHGIPDALVIFHQAYSVMTDENGIFYLENLRAGDHYIEIVAEGYNVMQATRAVEADENIVLEPFEMIHGEPYIAIEDTLRKELRPDGNRTRADLRLQNRGDGDLIYEVEVRYVDGEPLTYDTLLTLPADQLVRGGVIEENESIRAYSPLLVDSTWYIPCYSTDHENFAYIAVADMNGNHLTTLPSPVNGPEERLKNMAWDGESFWGGYYNQTDFNFYLIRFEYDEEDNVSITRTIELPFLQDGSFTIVYVPELESFIMANEEEDMIQITPEGEILRTWSITFQRRTNEISGLGWNPFDQNGMPLYIMDKYEVDEDVNSYNFVKMDIESGEYHIEKTIEIAYNENPQYRYTNGMMVMPNYSSTHCAVALIENYRGGGSATDLFVIREFGPNLSFMVDSSFVNKSGTLDSLEWLSFGFEVDANGFDEGYFYWSYFLEHNGFGDDIVVPVELHVWDGSGTNDDISAFPTEFALNAIYPNPFNNITRISFTVEQSLPTSIIIYDLAGRNVETIFDNTPEIGNHVISWDAAALSSGIYLVKLQSGDMSKTRKVLLIK